MPFVKRTPTEWPGRYRRIEGKEYVLHVRVDDSVDILLCDGRDEASCEAVMSQAMLALAEALNAVKSTITGRKGGAFVINEFGQALCPVAAPPWKVYYVGDCIGTPAFIRPDGSRFTLNTGRNAKLGEAWNRPYAGMAHNLSAANQIYFQMKLGRDTELMYPERQDSELIRAIRKIRPSGPVKFIVNLHGVVLTKVPPLWRPVYVGRINYDAWFLREDGKGDSPWR